MRIRKYEQDFIMRSVGNVYSARFKREMSAYATQMARLGIERYATIPLELRTEKTMQAVAFMIVAEIEEHEMEGV